MLSIGQLAKKFNLSRATILYYEREGLLKPSGRSENGYRWFGQTEIDRLATICTYRSFGIAVAMIPKLLDDVHNANQLRILKEQLATIESKVQQLKTQQNAILALLQTPELLEENMVTKERWVEIMKAAGLNETDMKNWHKQFEKMEPDAHQEFLESLSIADDEIVSIRKWSAE